MSDRGQFLSFEGIEGAGKTSNLQFVKQILESCGKQVVVTREPGGTVIAEKIRELLLDPELPGMHQDTELLLMFASRAEHVNQHILPALAQGHWVLCDRFADASHAYQGGGRQIDTARIEALEQWTLQGLKPDHTLLFDLPVALGLKRAKSRSDADRIEQEEQAFFERVRQNYLDRAAAEPERFIVVDASVELVKVQRALALALDKIIGAHS